VGFSPNGSAQGLILKTIASAQTSIDVLAYAFTSPEIAGALVQASKRGVRVRVVADHKHNLGSSGGNTRGRAALNTLVNAGAQVFTTDQYAIHHDKVLIVDARHVQTGSFNYSSSAASRNSENVLVVWDNPELARAYASHFARNLASARKLQSY
jgi:phosphatidylserine/phosphatidylglycerophosphate/cardiolipin synthase-like enzyme